VVETVEYRPIDKRRSDEIFTALPSEAKWGEVTGALLQGHTIFIPEMNRNQLESVRTIVNRRGYGRLRSKRTKVDGVEGRVLRLQRKAS
jgi:hypothetical protein